MSETQKHTKPNVPNLRFPGFEEEWERIRVSDLLDFFSTNSLSWEQLEYGGEEILNLHYGLIHNGLPTQINLEESILPSVKSEFKPRKYTLCKDGDVAFADASEDTNDVGKVVEFINCADREIVCGLHTIHGRDKLGKTVPGFKGYAFSSSAFHNQIRRIAQGTKIFSINTGCFEEIFIGLPNKEEQKKIASLLSLIDQRIAIQNRVIEDLKKLKAAIEDRCFNQFQGKLVRLAVILNEKNEKSTRNNQYEVLSSTVSGIYSQRDYFNKDIASADNTGYKVIRRGDIVLSPQNLWMGNINYNDRFDIGIVSPSYKVFSINPMFNNNYVASLLKSKKALWEYSLVSEQGASIVRRNLSIEGFMEIAFPVPKREKQNMIGDTIAAVNHRIELENGILNGLNRQKLYLLDQLFI